MPREIDPNFLQRLRRADDRMRAIGWDDSQMQGMSRYWLVEQDGELVWNVGTPDGMDLEASYMLYVAALELNGVNQAMAIKIMKLVIADLESRE